MSPTSSGSVPLVDDGQRVQKEFRVRSGNVAGHVRYEVAGPAAMRDQIDGGFCAASVEATARPGADDPLQLVERVGESTGGILGRRRTRFADEAGTGWMTVILANYCEAAREPARLSRDLTAGQGQWP